MTPLARAVSAPAMVPLPLNTPFKSTITRSLAEIVTPACVTSFALPLAPPVLKSRNSKVMGRNSVAKAWARARSSNATRPVATLSRSMSTRGDSSSPVDGGTAWDDPKIRQRLSQLLIDCEAMKYTRYRALTRQIRGEAPGPEGSILKLSGSELGVRIADAAGELLGMHAIINVSTELVPDAPRWFNRLVAARQYTISAGTSEIQRNILGERVLGLPKG